MTSPDTCHAVMFADIAGSTRWYETLGDKAAKALIDDCLERMADATHRHGGTVVKTIGDEIMCRFFSADEGIAAALDIQNSLELLPATAGTKVAVRIGVHLGPAILERGDIFGDAVNVAARMAGIARGRQIITTEFTVKNLGPELAGRARLFDRAPVRGKQAEMTIFEIVWEAQNAITCMTARLTSSISGIDELAPMTVRCGTQQKQVYPDGSGFVLGRGDDCNLVVSSNLTSRQHARIEYRRGKYILVDQSTNGTWVRLQDGKDVYLRREELPLWGEGRISLGEEIRDDDPALVYFWIPG